MTHSPAPSGSAQIKRVGSFHELAATPFTGGVNAICWERRLAGDFNEVAAKLAAEDGGRTTENGGRGSENREQATEDGGQATEDGGQATEDGGQNTEDSGVVALDEARLLALRSLGEGGRVAVKTMLEDLRLLQERGKDPVLNCIGRYPRDEGAGVVATDVMSWHVDSAPVEAETWLCTYHGAPSEGLRNDEARRKVDVPEIRAALLKEFGGEEGDAFREWLAENCYDLHYAPLAGAKPYSFGVGHLWRIACEWPGNSGELSALGSELSAHGSKLKAHGSKLVASPPCIHRAPETKPGDPARLLLIS